MAYNGYMLKVGDYTFPMNKIRLETYTIAPDQRQEFDSYVDGNGRLQRPNVVEHTRTKIEFETVYMSTSEMRTILNNVWANLTNVLKLECTVTYYDIETDTYKSGTFYMPGTREYTYYVATLMVQTRFAFIET